MGWSSDRAATLNVSNVASVTTEHDSLFQYTTAAGKTSICNSSQMCEFDAVRGYDYVLSFWRVVQNIVARVMRLVHV